MASALARIRHYIWTVLLGVDITVNAAAGGHPDQTVSNRAALAARDGKRWGRMLCRVLDAIKPCHCEDALQGDGDGD